MKLFNRKAETREQAEQRVVQVRRTREHAPLSDATARKLLARNLHRTGGFGGWGCPSPQITCLTGSCM